MKQLGNEGTSRVTKGNVRNKSARILCRHFVRSSNGQMWTDTCSSETERNVRFSRIRDRMRSLELLDNQGVEGDWSSVGRWLEVLICYHDFSEQRRRTIQILTDQPTMIPDQNLQKKVPIKWHCKTIFFNSGDVFYCSLLCVCVYNKKIHNKYYI